MKKLITLILSLTLLASCGERYPQTGYFAYTHIEAIGEDYVYVALNKTYEEPVYNGFEMAFTDIYYNATWFHIIDGVEEEIHLRTEDISYWGIDR